MQWRTTRRRAGERWPSAGFRRTPAMPRARAGARSRARSRAASAAREHVRAIPGVRALEPAAQLDLRLVACQLARPGHVGAAALRRAGRRRERDDLDLLADGRRD